MFSQYFGLSEFCLRGEYFVHFHKILTKNVKEKRQWNTTRGLKMRQKRRRVGKKGRKCRAFETEAKKLRQ